MQKHALGDRKISSQIFSRAGAQRCSLMVRLFVLRRLNVHLDAGEVRVAWQASSSLPLVLWWHPQCHHLPSSPPQTPVLDVPHSSRLGRGSGHIIDLAFVFLFKFGKAQARWPPLCAMPRHALCWRCHTHHRPPLQTRVPS